MFNGTRGSSGRSGHGAHAAAITALLLAGAMMLPVSAMAHGRHRRHRHDDATQVDPPITACQTITAAGYYTVSNNLTGTPNSICLEITHDDVTLNLNALNLSGAASGTGIQIDAGVNNTYIVGASNFDVVPGVISGFTNGIVDNGNYTFIEDVNANQNLGDGIYSRGAIGSSYLDFNTNYDQTGIEIDNTGSTISLPAGTGLLFSDFQADHNSNDGIYIHEYDNHPASHPIVKSIFVTLADISSNAANGFNLSNAQNVALTAFATTSNAQSGVVIGGAISTENIVQGGEAVSNAGDGILVNGTDTRVSANIAQTNAQSDMVDTNTNCDDNHWFGNTFGTASQACIQ